MTKSIIPGATSTAVKAPGRFGWFAGVFTPSILTILGVVMYMRLGWVTGQAGLGGTLLIVFIAHVITFSTALSVASIATNRTVGAGGAYYMISRALGAPAGAAIGIPLFLAQALSVTFYIVGFTESLLQLFPEGVRAWIPSWIVSTLVNIAVTALSYKSAELAIKAQYVVMAAIGVSLLALFFGGSDDPPASIAWSNPDGVPLTAVFAVFFPAATGLMAGVSMSGELKDPKKDLPLGTLLAVAVGFVIYMTLPVVFAMNYDNAYLIEHLDSAFTLAWWAGFVYLGVWGATLSSALGSILTAPRTLQALALDGLVPRKLGEGEGPNLEPRIGMLVTFGLAQVGILVGSLDAIAPVLTMFFLATYGLTNLVCGLQKWAASPSFRPTFQVPALVSLFGALACFYVMSIINLLAMFVALGFCAAIFVWTQSRGAGGGYSDSRHGIWAALVRASLHALQRESFSELNWRPNVMVVGGDPTRNATLLEIASLMVQRRGLVSYVHTETGDPTERSEERKRLLREVGPRVQERFPLAFYSVEISPDPHTALCSAAQIHGIGGIRPNVTMLRMPDTAVELAAMAPLMRSLAALDQSVILVHPNHEREFGATRRLDIYWRSHDSPPSMTLLLASLMVAGTEMRGAQIDVCAIVGEGITADSIETTLVELLRASRLDASHYVFESNAGDEAQVMHEQSSDADLVFLGLNIPPVGADSLAWAETMLAEATRLPTSCYIAPAPSFQGTVLFLDAA